MRRLPTGTPDDAVLPSMRSASRRPIALFSGTVDAESPYPISSFLPCRQTEASGYPELFALMGGRVPDLRGLFLRGHGGNSAGLGTRQDESVYIAPGSAQISIASQIYVVKAGHPGTAGNHDRPVGVDVLAPRNADGGSGTFQIKRMSGMFFDFKRCGNLVP